MVLFEVGIGYCILFCSPSRLPPLTKQQNSLLSPQITAFFLSLFKNLLAPYVNWLVQLVASPATTRKAVQSLVVCIAFGLLVCVAMIAYLVFYWAYIPQLHHVGHILLQYELPT